MVKMFERERKEIQGNSSNEKRSTEKKQNAHDTGVLSLIRDACQ